MSVKAGSLKPDDLIEYRKESGKVINGTVIRPANDVATEYLCRFRDIRGIYAATCKVEKLSARTVP